MGRLLAGWVLASLALLLGPIVPVHAQAPTSPKLPTTKGWVEVRSTHFILDSRAGTTRTRKLAVQLERFLLALDRPTEGLALDTPAPTLIVVFPNDEELTPFKINKHGFADHVSGYFLSGPFRNFLVLDASAGDAPMRVVYLEYFHAVTGASTKTVSLDLGEEVEKVEASDRPLEAPEIYLRLGELQADRGRREEAVRLLGAARAAGAPTAAVETALGRAAFVNADKADAESHFRKAVEAGADVAEPFVALGEILTEREASSSRPAPADARALFQKALERDGTSFPALVGLARTYVFESDTRPGVEAIDAARKRRPFDGAAIMVDACLRARSGRPDSASQLVAGELAPRDPEVARQAKSCIITGTVAAVRDRIQANDVEGAKTIAALAIAAIDDPAARSQFERIQTGLALGNKIVFQDADASTAKTAADAALGAFNEAVELANAGRSEEGLARFDAIATACSDPDICARAKKAASDLRPVVTHNRWVKRYNEGVTLASGGKYKDATGVFRELEKEVDDPKLLASVRDMLRKLGQKPSP